MSAATEDDDATAVAEPTQRATPFVCPYCGEETLRPEPQGRWHCRSCLRLFSVTFHGLTQPNVVAPPTSSGSEEP